MNDDLAVTAGYVHAPEINRPGLTWLNTDRPLGLADLKGKVVLLDFWTFCCINCMHILPTLRKIEEAFPDDVMVIGVHSPKFKAEADIHKVKQAIARYDIRHPVVHDPGFQIWREYNIHAWPTLVFIDPSGRIMGVNAGEPDPLHLMNSVRDAIEHFEATGTLKPSPFTFATPKTATNRLSFPGKIKPLPGDEKLWMVADSGHHQIVVFDDAGNERARYGSGKQGALDGPAHQAMFNSPQGLTANATHIYVADTNNHAIRAISRATGDVTSIAGNGTRGMMLVNQFERAYERALASPWDLEIKNQYLFFANAGTHQIGGIDLQQNAMRLVAGSGGEDIQDGPVLAALMAQPSSLAFNTKSDRLYFADSETSSIRYIDMNDARIHTVVGTGLFDFGHVNGAFDGARLQHALGLSLINDNKLAVADSYNNALRLLDLESGMASDLEDSSFTCLDSICTPYDEPAGIWADGPNRLLVSDTNNHRIVEVRLDKKTTKTWA